MLTRGVCRSMPGFLGVAFALVTAPHATSPAPPSFSLAKMKMTSPLAMCFPPYIVFASLNVKAVACGSAISVLIANIDRLLESFWLQVDVAAEQLDGGVGDLRGVVVGIRSNTQRPDDRQPA